MTKGLGYYKTCEPASHLAPVIALQLPKNLESSQVCKLYAFGLQTAEILLIVEATNESTSKLAVEAYPLSKDGQPVDAHFVDNYILVAFCFYYVIFTSAFGATLGGRIMFTRVIDVSNPKNIGVPIKKTILRFLVMQIGTVPLIFACVAYFLLVFDGNRFVLTGLSSAIYWLCGAAAIYAVWICVILFQIVTRRDTIYDRLAGTAVIESEARNNTLKHP